MTDNYYNSQLQNNEEESSITLADLWNMIWGYKWWYVACTAVCLFLAAVTVTLVMDINTTKKETTSTDIVSLSE